MTKTFDINGLSSKAERDAFDLQNEMAGNVTGRPQRFLSKDKRDGMKIEERRRQRDAHSRLAAMMLADPEYAALYEDTANALNEAEEAANRALGELNDKIEGFAAELEVMEDAASMLPDGTKVFRSADGAAFTENGRELSAEEIGTVSWQDGAPAWEDYLALKQQLQKVSNDRDAVLAYQNNVLNPAHQRLDDEDNPPTKDELKQIQTDLKEKAPPAVKERMAPEPVEVSSQSSPSSEVQVLKF